MPVTFTVLYQLPSGWWTAGTFATHAEAVASGMSVVHQQQQKQEAA